MPKSIKGHKPVLLKEVLAHAPIFPPGQDKQMLDTTFGCGGHTKAFLEHFPNLFVTAIDRDMQAIEWGKKHVLPFLPPKAQHRLKLVHACFYPFSDLIKKNLFPTDPFFDIILLDLGVSSLQLDQANRGFSFYKDGPLDMRMDQSQGLKASDIINQFSESELKNLFCQDMIPSIPYEKTDKSLNKTAVIKNRQKTDFSLWTLKSKRDKININKVVKAILKEREKKPIKSTKELSDLIVKQTGWRKKGRHPATTYFLALRLKVNQELLVLAKSLSEMIKSLNPRGRIFVLSFHSAEDRIVKLIFKKAKKDKTGKFFKKALFPSREEIKQNPRARSAKLRVFEKT